MGHLEVWRQTPRTGHSKRRWGWSFVKVVSRHNDVLIWLIEWSFIKLVYHNKGGVIFWVVCVQVSTVYVIIHPSVSWQPFCLFVYSSSYALMSACEFVLNLKFGWVCTLLDVLSECIHFVYLSCWNKEIARVHDLEDEREREWERRHLTLINFLFF